MPLYLRQSHPLTGVWKTEERPDELRALLLHPCNDLPPDIRAEGRRAEWLAVRVLLKELLGEETPVAYHPNGAPYLPEKNRAISISHTKGYVAVQLREDAPAGIDIECRRNRVLNVRRRFLSPEEDACIDPLHEVDHLLIYWCAKETLYKMIGQEEVDFARHLHVAPFLFHTTGGLVVTETRTPQAASYRLMYMIENDFVLTARR